MLISAKHMEQQCQCVVWSWALLPMRATAKLGPKAASEDFQVPDLSISAILNIALTYTHIHTTTNK